MIGPSPGMRRFVEKKIIPHIQDTAGMDQKTLLRHLQTKRFVRRFLDFDERRSQNASDVATEFRYRFGWQRKTVAIGALVTSYSFTLIPKAVNVLLPSKQQAKTDSLAQGWDALVKTYDGITLVIGATLAIGITWWLSRFPKENYEPALIEQGGETWPSIMFKAIRTLATISACVHLITGIPSIFVFGFWSYLSGNAASLAFLLSIYLISPTSDILKKFIGGVSRLVGNFLEKHYGSQMDDETKKFIDDLSK